MRYKDIRQFNFPLHRYLGLVVGVIFAIVGLTGSALVFQHELDQAAIALQYGAIVPKEHRLSPEAVLDQVNDRYAHQEPIAIAAIEIARSSTVPDKVKIKSVNGEPVEVLVNPYTGDVIGERHESTLFKGIHQLHDHLLIGKIGNVELGKMIVGSAAFLFLVINFTGVVLWDGWRKLDQGFKIKWHAKPLRVNYDIHKVVGIVAAIFLTLTALTGFLWNFKLDKPLAHLITASPSHQDVKKSEANGVSGRAVLSVAEVLRIADAALPGAMTTKIKLPEKPNDVFKVHKKFPQERWAMGHSRVAIAPCRGNVLEVKNGLNLSPYEQILRSFEEIHYGTFAGLPTRILYVLIGITPLILLVTSLVMYTYRRPKSNGSKSQTLPFQEQGL
ncbi:MAG: PepSY domain-containing protein [Leptolyngbyaceae cyanobacterium RU_5_1]|nr:PepSY domain-containing protein [Leptolyngbyaceae cyanobacterium RU_5_1]